jgi:hypothetical protein
MTTMRPLFRRVELSWIGFLLVGTLCGALLMFGADALRQSTHNVSAPVVAAPAAISVPVESRRASMVSADTASGWYLLHEYTVPALPSTGATNRGNVLGQRDVAASTVISQQIGGPVEGPNTVASDSAANNSIPPIIDPAEGLNQKR